MFKFIQIFITIGLLCCSDLLSAATANYNVQGSYNDDYDLWVGVGNTANPDWMQQVAFRGNGNFDETNGFITIPDAYLWGNTWWLHADDNWGWDDGNILSFIIDVNGTQYVAPNTPIYIPDTEDRFAFVSMPTDPNAVPEPTTITLMGLGFAGLGYARRKVTPA